MSTSPPSPRGRWSVGAAIVLVLAAACVAVGIGVVRTITAPPEEIPLPVATAEPAVVYVHVSGAVASPGLYRLGDGARLIDAVSAAGGLMDDADPAAVNLARKLTDGEQVHLPVVGEEPAPSERADGRVNINTADAAALESLPRIGPALAERILAWRHENGPFTSIDDLLAVSGIGEKLLATLRERVTL